MTVGTNNSCRNVEDVEVNFVVDSVNAALAASCWPIVSNLSITYELKKIYWNGLDYRKLFDVILGSRVEAKVAEYQLPHGYFFPGTSKIARVLEQRRIARNVREVTKFDDNQLYIGCPTSSFLAANNKSINYALVDEGMASILLRHNIKNDRSLNPHRLRRKFKSRLLPMNFNPDVSQFTFTGDIHHLVKGRIYLNSYTGTPLISAFNVSQQLNAVLVLLRTPEPTSSGVSRNVEDQRIYVDLNVRIVEEFIEKFGHGDCQFILKMHPSANAHEDFAETVARSLRSRGIASEPLHALSTLDSDITHAFPIELIAISFSWEAILAIDISSALWNLGGQTEIPMYLALNSTYQFSHQNFSEASALYQIQPYINSILGFPVKFF
jgi:hypothetical protein